MFQRAATLLMMILLSSAGASQAQESEPVWSEDLAVYAAQLEAKHIDLDHTLPGEEFERELGTLNRMAQSRSYEETLLELMRLTRRIGDGHTSIPLWGAPMHRFPFQISIVEGKAMVTGTSPDDQELLGAILVSINGVPIERVIRDVSPIVPFSENAQSNRVRIGQYILVEEILAGLGIARVGEATELEFATDHGPRIKRVRSLDRAEYSALGMAKLKTRDPRIQFQMQGGTERLWFGTSEDKRSVYVQFDSYPSREEMGNFGQEVRSFIDAAGAVNLIVDLRNNFGGDFFTGLELASYLNLADSIDWRRGVYVLIGPRTYSAAMSNAVQFRQILNARLIGEPTGARPCGFQDMGQFELPNSKLIVTYSKRRFCFENTTDDAVQPDVEIVTSAKHLAQGEDPVIAWVLADIEGRGN